ncbi:MAG: tetratricopeptide repeat protein, partial [Holophagales bacterium]|nr:tetratricopeptide repeat protein [Holophagales bacterium]
AGDLATAECYHRRAVELYRATVGEHHPNLAYAHQQYAGQLSRRGEVGPATRSYRRAIATMAGGLGPSHPRLVWLYSQLAVHLASHGRGGEEEARAALELSEGVGRSSGTAVAMVALARVLGEQGRVAEARQVEESLRAAAAEIPARFRRRVAGLYASWQRPEAARFWSELGSASSASGNSG